MLLTAASFGLAAGCVAPGTCTPPAAKYSRVIPGPQPSQQWNINGGFCGAMSVQQAALAFGAWISQDLVRKANTHGEGHGDPKDGYEVLPSNVGETAKNLKLTYDEWDYNQPSPQAPAFKKWIKSHLTKGEPIVFFPMCKGDSHCPYTDSCPNGGHFDHVEPMWGIFSNHSLDDPEVYDDDVILHGSDQDLETYYRPMSTLEDDSNMEGNCKEAGAGFGKNEMYPCVDKDVTYGISVTGLATKGTLPVSLTVDTTQEPDVRMFQKPSEVHGTVTVSGLTAGSSYVLYRFKGTENLPAGPDFEQGSSYSRIPFNATDTTWTYADPEPFMSNTATYYVATPAPYSIVV